MLQTQLPKPKQKGQCNVGSLTNQWISLTILLNTKRRIIRRRFSLPGLASERSEPLLNLFSYSSGQTIYNSTGFRESKLSPLISLKLSKQNPISFPLSFPNHDFILPPFITVSAHFKIVHFPDQDKVQSKKRLFDSSLKLKVYM